MNNLQEFDKGGLNLSISELWLPVVEVVKIQ